MFVSSLLADGTDPMAIRLAILAHHYSHDWDWTAAGLAAAAQRLARWREAVGQLLAGPPGPASQQDGPASPPGGPASPPGALAAAEAVLAAMRERMADDLDAPGALAAVDRWAREVAGMPGLPAGSAAAGSLVGAAVDALLGVAL